MNTNTKTLCIFAISVAVGASCYAMIFFATATSFHLAAQSTALSCTDTDGGRNLAERGWLTFSTPGIPWGQVNDNCVLITGKTGFPTYESLEECSGANCFLVEESCNGNRRQEEYIPCPHGCSNATCGEPAEGTCTDSDNANDFVKGTRRYSSGDTGVIDDDVCMWDGTMHEHYCNSSRYAVGEGRTCEFGCANGACIGQAPTPVTCSDSDGGKNEFVKGIAKSSTRGSSEDFCDGNSVYEKYCEGSEYSFTKIPCANGCKDGACLPAPNEGTKTCGNHKVGETWAVGCQTCSCVEVGGEAQEICSMNPCEPKPVCGNNICEKGEEGSSCYTTSDGLSICSATAGCPSDCPKKENTCGNNICEEGEDPCHIDSDGNYVCVADDGCPSDCPKIKNICGNGLCEGKESAYGCDPSRAEPRACEGYILCRIDCSWSLACGNGIVDWDEDCDDGNTIKGDGCSPDCRREIQLFPEGLPPAGYEEEVRVINTAGSTQNWFLDVSPETPVGRAANFLAENGIIGGFPDKTFREGNLVNRAETAKFMMLARFKTVEERSNNGRFWDVLEGQWYVKFVMKAAELGVINGHADGSFKPQDPVTTAEFLKMAAETFGLEKDLPFMYTDVRTDDWFSSYVGIPQKFNLFPERASDQLEPHRQLTRGEVAVALFKILAPQN